MFKRWDPSLFVCHHRVPMETIRSPSPLNFSLLLPYRLRIARYFDGCSTLAFNFSSSFLQLHFSISGHLFDIIFLPINFHHQKGGPHRGRGSPLTASLGPRWEAKPLTWKCPTPFFDTRRRFHFLKNKRKQCFLRRCCACCHSGSLFEHGQRSADDDESAKGVNGCDKITQYKSGSSMNCSKQIIKKSVCKYWM